MIFRFLNKYQPLAINTRVKVWLGGTLIYALQAELLDHGTMLRGYSNFRRWDQTGRSGLLGVGLLVYSLAQFIFPSLLSEMWTVSCQLPQTPTSSLMTLLPCQDLKPWAKWIFPSLGCFARLSVSVVSTGLRERRFSCIRLLESCCN